MKRCDHLFDLDALALGTTEFRLLVFRDRHDQAELFVALLAFEIVSRHGRHLPSKRVYPSVDHIYFNVFVNSYGGFLGGEGTGVGKEDPRTSRAGRSSGGCEEVKQI